MTSSEFRKMALEIPMSVERSHMNHPDFRVAGKIFASLGAPDANWGMVKLAPDQQRAFIEKAPQFYEAVPRRLGPRRSHRMFILPPQKRALCVLPLKLRQRTSFHARTSGRDREDALTNTRGACATERFGKTRARMLVETDRVRFHQFEIAK